MVGSPARPSAATRSSVGPRCVQPISWFVLTSPQHLKRHHKSIHCEDRPFTCPFPGCGKTFARVRPRVND